MTITEPTNVFGADLASLWEHRWEAEILVGTLLAGNPGDPKLIEGYLRSKMRGKSDDDKRAFVSSLYQQVVQEVSESTANLSENETIELVLEETAKKGGEIFKRDPADGVLYEEGRKVASMLREAASIQWPNAQSKRPAVMRKNARQWWPEHVYVLEDRIPLGRTEPDDLMRRVVHTTGRFGEPQSGFAMHEVVRDARLAFTIVSDVDLNREHWGSVWSRAMFNGFGAARSMGYGRFIVTRFDKVDG